MTTSPVKAAVPANPKEARPQMQMADANGRCKLAMQTGNANSQWWTGRRCAARFFVRNDLYPKKRRN
jgi:hypothetical protein